MGKLWIYGVRIGSKQGKMIWGSGRNTKNIQFEDHINL